ncbi:unnamed protein product [marine sediment metagenome]|uniref:Uncharacterized protein n=1 Tax=marine sediment metagenome TaxID=412755 RepID=X1S1M3_9ZZZZ
MTGYAAFMSYCLALPPVVPTEVTFYSDAHPEVTSVDGRLYYLKTNQAFSFIVAGPGSGSDDSSDYLNATIYSGEQLDTFSAVAFFDLSP